MASRQQELKSIISIHGRVDGSLKQAAWEVSQLGKDMQKLGSAMTLITAPVVAAGKASLDLFTDYDDVMRKIQAAGEYTEKEMDVLSGAARQAGADTRFMALDAGEAILYLTQAGVGLEGTMKTLPTLLNAAAAGDMELATASDLLISNIYSLGKSFDEADTSRYVDQVTTAADATNTTLEELMTGVSKVGAAGRLFGGGTEELLGFLGLLSNLNLKGSTGGINARNMIISLLAPTQQATELMEALSISEEEVTEALDDVNLSDSAKTMEKLGLKATDAEGRVRPMIDILTDLKAATDGMTDDDKAKTLYSMFGKRTYPAVAGLLEILDEYPELLANIENSMGSAARKADILEGGVGGATRRMKSAFQELGLSVGEAIDDKAIEWMDGLRGMMLSAADWFQNVDPAVISSAMDLIGTLAVAGPALTLSGKALSSIGTVLGALTTTPGQIEALALAVSGFAFAMNEAQDAAAKENIESHFGTLEMDVEKVKGYYQTLTTETNQFAKSLNGYSTAISGAADSYQTALSQFSGGLLEAYLTKTELNETDKAALEAYAQDMITTVQGAIATQKLSLSDIIDFTFDGSHEGDAEKKAGWEEMLGGVFGDYEQEAAAAGRELMDAYYQAIADGTITAAEQEAIAAIQERLTRLMDEIMGFQSKLDMNTALAKAGDLSWGTLEEHGEMLSALLTDMDKAADEEFYKLEGLIKTYEDAGDALPDNFQNQYGIGAHDYDGLRAANREELRNQKLDNRLLVDRAQAGIWDEAFDTYMGEEGPIAHELIKLAESVQRGEITLPEAKELAEKLDMGFQERGRLANGFSEMMDTFSKTMSWEDLMGQIRREKELYGQASPELLELQKDYIAMGIHKGNLMGGNRYEINGRLSTEMDPYRQATQGQLNIGGNTIEATTADLAISTTPDPQEAAAEYATQSQGTLDAAGVTLNVRVSDFLSAVMGQAYAAQGFLDSMSFRINVSGGGGIGGGPGAGSRGVKRAGSRVGKIVKKFAEGGYADTPSIFGEDGPEWAIPQERTASTLRLLRQAAAASGFTPEEVYREDGKKRETGLSFTYAPTIYAKDAQGVKDALEKDRAELETMLNEWWEKKTSEEERVSFA